MKMLIGLCAQRNVGNSTVANLLKTKYGFKKRSFEEGSKNTVKKYLGLNEEQLQKEMRHFIIPKWNKTPQELLDITRLDLLTDNLVNEEKFNKMMKDSVFVRNMMYSYYNKLKSNKEYIITIDGVPYIDMKNEDVRELIINYCTDHTLKSLKQHNYDNVIYCSKYFLTEEVKKHN